MRTPRPHDTTGTVPEALMGTAQGGRSALTSSSSATSPAMGAQSLGASLAFHGAAVASLVLTISVPWLLDDEGSRPTLQTQLAFERPEPAIDPDPEPEEPADLTEAMPSPDVPEPDAWEVPAAATPDPFPEFFGAEAELEMSVVKPVFELHPLRVLRDPELPREEEALAEETPPTESSSEPNPESTPDPTLEEIAPEPVEDEGPPSILSPSPIRSECPPPAYPRIAERRGWTGTVVLLIDVDAQGLVSGVTIESTSGHDVLDDAAVEAVRTWRFRPGTLNGSAAPLVVRKPIRFGL
ncbi:MAG: energy transducer TonB [Planctomycetota bacterium]